MTVRFTKFAGVTLFMIAAPFVGNKLGVVSAEVVTPITIAVAVVMGTLTLMVWRIESARRRARRA